MIYVYTVSLFFTVQLPGSLKNYTSLCIPLTTTRTKTKHLSEWLETSLYSFMNQMFFSTEQLAIFTRFPGFVFRNDSKYTKLINNTEAEDCAHACIMAPQFNCNSFAYNHGNRICALSGDVVESPDDILRVGTYDTFQYSGGKYLSRIVLLDL